MDLTSIGNKIGTNITAAWSKVAVAYTGTVVPLIKIPVHSLSASLGSGAAFGILGVGTFAAFCVGRSIYTLEFKKIVKDAAGKEDTIESPKSKILQLALRIIGLSTLLAASVVAGGLIAVGTGHVGAAIGVTAGLGLLGTFA